MFFWNYAYRNAQLSDSNIYVNIELAQTRVCFSPSGLSKEVQIIWISLGLSILFIKISLTNQYQTMQSSTVLYCWFSKLPKLFTHFNDHMFFFLTLQITFEIYSRYVSFNFSAYFFLMLCLISSQLREEQIFKFSFSSWENKH